MYEKPTDELEEMLRQMKPEELPGYLQGNRGELADGKAFCYYVKDLIRDKGIRLKDVYSFAGVSEKYGGQILSMEKHTKNRDLILRLLIAGHLTPEELNRSLKLYKMTPLYAKDPRDAVLIVAINRRCYDLATIDELLEGQGLEKLSADSLS